MTAEVEYLLDRLDQVVNAQPTDHPLELVNRNESTNVSDSARRGRDDLKDANYVLVDNQNTTSEVRGHEYNRDLDVVCSVRIEGLHHNKFGHIDPDGSDGVPFYDTFDAQGNIDTKGLVRQVRERILNDRTYPDVGGPDSYRHLLVEGDSQAPDYEDSYRYDLTVTFVKTEEP